MLITIELGNLHNINKNIEAEMEQLRSQVGWLALERDSEQTEHMSIRAKFEKAERMLEAINDHITNMCMGLQGSTMTEFHRRDPKEDYS